MLARVGVGSTRRKRIYPQTHLLQQRRVLFEKITWSWLPLPPVRFVHFRCQILYRQFVVLAYEVLPGAGRANC